jgi:hypothetical protein
VRRLLTAVARQVLLVLLRAAVLVRRFQRVLSLHHLLLLLLLQLPQSVSLVSMHLQQHYMLLQLAQAHSSKRMQQLRVLSLPTRVLQQQQIKRHQTAAASLSAMSPSPHQLQHNLPKQQQ